MGAGRLLDDKLVPGRPAGIDPGAHHHGAQVGDEALAPGDDLLIEGGGGQIPVNRLHIADAVRFQAFFHVLPPGFLTPLTVITRLEA